MLACRCMDMFHIEMHLQDNSFHTAKTIHFLLRLLMIRTLHNLSICWHSCNSYMPFYLFQWSLESTFHAHVQSRYIAVASLEQEVDLHLLICRDSKVLSNEGV